MNSTQSFDSHALHVEIHGAEGGFPVILLHHGLGSVRAWSEQIPALTAAGYWVIAYDRWGYGRSAPRPALDLPSFATDVADLHDLFIRLDIERATLVGHSDGGTLALYYAVQYPKLVASLVTIAAHIYIEPSMSPSLEAVRENFEHNVRFRQALKRVHGEQVETVFHNWYDGWRRLACQDWDLRPELSSIACPALVVQGSQDEHATPQHARDIAVNIPGAELWLLEGAAHMLPQENATEFNRKVLHFLSDYAL
jgi:pimeloyl-ACP methyl ester carboxylesterase